VGHAGGGVTHTQSSPAAARRHVQFVVPYEHSRFSVGQVPIGFEAGHIPHAHISMPPPGPMPAAQVHCVAPYVQAPSAAHAAPPAMHAPVGCGVGQTGHVVHVHTGFALPSQSHTTLP
jgi:hypothetical protein